MRGSVRFERLIAILIIAACIGCSKAPSVKPAEKPEKAEELEKELAPRRTWVGEQTGASSKGSVSI